MYLVRGRDSIQTTAVLHVQIVTFTSQMTLCDILFSIMSTVYLLRFPVKIKGYVTVRNRHQESWCEVVSKNPCQMELFVMMNDLNFYTSNLKLILSCERTLYHLANI